MQYKYGAYYYHMIINSIDSIIDYCNLLPSIFIFIHPGNVTAARLRLTSPLVGP